MILRQISHICGRTSKDPLIKITNWIWIMEYIYLKVFCYFTQPLIIQSVQKKTAFTQHTKKTSYFRSEADQQAQEVYTIFVFQKYFSTKTYSKLFFSLPFALIPIQTCSYCGHRETNSLHNNCTQLCTVQLTSDTSLVKWQHLKTAGDIYRLPVMTGCP